MVTDRYTKFVLTVIAMCLVWISITSAPRSVQAQSVQHVIIDDATPNDARGIPIWVTQPIETKAAASAR